MKSTNWMVVLGASLVLVGCGGGATSSNEASKITAVPETFSNKVINNKGTAVEGTVDGYGIKIYSDSKEAANPQAIHKGVVVKVNGKTSEVMPIEISYLGKSIVVALLNNKGEEVAVSDKIEVTDVPVIVVEMNL